MPKIMNKSGKCDNWTSQSKAPLFNYYEIMKNKQFDCLNKEGNEVVYLMLDLPTICSEENTYMILRHASRYKQPKFPFFYLYKNVSNSANIRTITFRGGICTVLKTLDISLHIEAIINMIVFPNGYNINVHFINIMKISSLYNQQRLKSLMAFPIDGSHYKRALYLNGIP